MNYKTIPKHLSGFSLIELALVLIVIGILTGAIFKGQDILEAAKYRAVLNEIERIRTAVSLYHDTFGQWPGNDSEAKMRFGNSVENGQGNGIFSAGEKTQFWIHLAKAAHLPELTAPSSKLGGQFSVEGDLASRKNFLVLSQPEKAGLLTPKQAATLKAKAGEKDPLGGQILITEGSGAANGSCIREGVFNFTVNTPNCILRVELN
jgi:prepilin-type N-terminal cleavage/methylation domain-containing protein